MSEDTAPRFSIVVPAYNAEPTLAETLDAVLAQEYIDWECIVVDDGSTDGTAAAAQSYVDGDSRFHLIRQQNMGTSGAYRTGCTAAVADLLTICSADDWLLPRHLVVMDALVRVHPECGIFSSNGECLNERTGLRSVVYEGEEWQHERSLTFEQVLTRCFFSVGAVFRRDVYEMTSGHRAGIIAEDYDLWLRAMARGVKHCYTPEVLAVHRVSSYQLSADAIRVFESDIAAYRNLVAEGLVTGSRVPLVEAAIATTENRIVEEKARLGLVRQGEQLRARVERVVGARLADPALKVIHLFSWITRPARRLLIKRRVRSS